MDAEIKRIASKNSVRTPPIAKQGQKQQGGSRSKTKKAKKSKKSKNRTKKSRKN
jgi:hypothetical protein